MKKIAGVVLVLFLGVGAYASSEVAPCDAGPGRWSLTKDERNILVGLGARAEAARKSIEAARKELVDVQADASDLFRRSSTSRGLRTDAPLVYDDKNHVIYLEDAASVSSWALNKP